MTDDEHSNEIAVRIKFGVETFVQLMRTVEYRADKYIKLVQKQKDLLPEEIVELHHAFIRDMAVRMYKEVSDDTFMDTDQQDEALQSKAAYGKWYIKDD